MRFSPSVRTEHHTKIFMNMSKVVWMNESNKQGLFNESESYSLAHVVWYMIEQLIGAGSF